MIEVKVPFWTNDIARAANEIVPKHAWASGVVRMESNKTHGIAPGKPAPFHSLMDPTAVIEKVLMAHGVTLIVNRRMRKYMIGNKEAFLGADPPAQWRRRPPRLRVFRVPAALLNRTLTFGPEKQNRKSSLETAYFVPLGSWDAA